MPSGLTTQLAPSTHAGYPWRTLSFLLSSLSQVGGASHNKEQSAYDRRRRQGAGPASDVWSLACLLYELVTGEWI